MQHVNRKRRTRWRALVKADQRRRGLPGDPLQAWFEQQRAAQRSGEFSEPVLLGAIAAATAWCTAPVGVADDFEFWLRRAVRHRSRRAAKPHPIAVSTIRLLNSWVSMRRTLEENGHRRLVGSLLGLLSAFADELNAVGVLPVRSPPPIRLASTRRAGLHSRPCPTSPPRRLPTCPPHRAPSR